MIFVSSRDNKINYNPQNTLEEIVANVNMIMRVYKEEQPLKRDFAMETSFIDKNINVIENELATHFIEVFKKYEPRVNLQEVQIEMADVNNNDFEITLGLEVLIK